MYMQIANEKYFFFFLVWNSQLPPKKRRGNQGGGHALVCLVCIESPRSMNTKGGGPLQKHTQTSGVQNFRGVLSQVASTSNHTPSLSLFLSVSLSQLACWSAPAPALALLYVPYRVVLKPTSPQWYVTGDVAIDSRGLNQPHIQTYVYTHTTTIIDTAGII